MVSLIVDPNATFEADAKDYIVSILSSILAFFDIKRRWLKILINIIPIAISYIGRDFKNPQIWLYILYDAMFIIIGEIIGGALDRKKNKQINNAIDKVSKNKRKLSNLLWRELNGTKLRIKHKFNAMGIAITFALDISSKIIGSIATIFLK